MFEEKITEYYQGLIDTEVPDGPLARMLRVSECENKVREGETEDPTGDAVHSRCANGRLIHRYRDRALLLVTDRCPAHCRFCFRRRLVGKTIPDISDNEIEEVSKYLSLNEGIKEIVLSGGDPLSLSNSRLLEIIGALKAKSGLSVRVHTRYPVYMPSRCSDFHDVASLVDTFMLHVNHAKEITPQFKKAAAVLGESAFLLNQSVLLKGVNDSVDELEALSRGLFSAGILPAYLHYPDIAPGISHFRIPLKKALGLMNALQKQLSGYLVPRLLIDIPGGQGKVVLSKNPSFPPDGKILLKSPLSGELREYLEII